MMTHIFDDAQQTAEALLEYMLELVNESPDRNFHIAFSGGSTPSMMFKRWASSEYAGRTPWERLYFYWVDERCVPADSDESNYGVMKRLLLDKVPMREDHIFPINGMNDPSEEAARYERQAREQINQLNGSPAFDIVLLGAGDDGHTSSIFPGQNELLTCDEWFAPSINPYTHQKRVAMTAKAILSANRLVFLVTGANKREVVKDMLSTVDRGPASYIAHRNKNAELFMDVFASGYNK